MAGGPERAGGSADAALPRRPPLCLARNCLTVRQFGPLESFDPNDAMILPHGANPDRMTFSERTRRSPDFLQMLSASSTTAPIPTTRMTGATGS
jgi:hypothetical protein